jgi:Ca2+-transporting ATPase
MPDAPESSEPVELPWAQSVSEVLEAIQTEPEEGLSAEEAARRLEEVGPNKLREKERTSLVELLVDQFKSPVVWLLVVAAAVALGFGETLEAAAIGVVLVLNAGIGFFTEYGAVRSMEALRKMTEIETRVRRDGRIETISGRDLVPGDVVVLEQGDVVPADLRLVEVDDLQVDESALTGESVPVDKHREPVDAEVPLADRECMAYKGTAVTRGAGEGVVVATGMDSELGEVASLVQSAESGQTPLEQRLDRLGNKLVWLVVVTGAAVAGAGVMAGRDTFLMIETGIALAIAAVPEGLPIVATVALSYGMWQMKKRHALIRQLPSVETLGATTLIFTDKTGTLTENRMTVRALIWEDLRASVADEGGEADGGGGRKHLEVDGERVDLEEQPGLERAARTAVLANTATDEDRHDADQQGEAGADPMELALLNFGAGVGISRGALLEEYPLARTEPFDRDTQMMGTFHEHDDGYVVAVKGAPEAVLAACERKWGDETAFDEETRRAWRERNEQLADEGLRVLGLATRQVSSVDAEPYEELEWLGLVGMWDPPRREIRSVIDQCQAAGIRVVMVTGDHPSTAHNVAEAVGLIDENGEPVTSDEIGEFGTHDDQQRRRLLDTEIFARVTPAQKLELIDLHQGDGQVVAMTGDGVNDAPALQSADIGIAMGQRGTEVAREASDMVLLDDAFESIVAAIEQGRVIFGNIRRFVVYLLSGNVGEILAVGGASVAGAPLPLLPLQILYLNILNDVFPALALGVGPGSGGEMDEPPREAGTAILEAEHWWEIAGYGLVIAGTVGGTFAYALGPAGMSAGRAVTVSFLTLSVTRLFYVLNMRKPTSGVVSNEITRNPWVWGALGLDIGLLAFAVYYPPLAEVLSVEPPGIDGWLMVAVGAMIPLVLGQVYLGVRSLRGS